MITTHSLPLFSPETKTVVTIGTFDGVHLGHQRIIKQLVAKAKALHLPSLVLTFYPHPRMVLQQDTTIRMLQSLEERAQKLEALGVDYLVIYPFTEDFSKMHAKDFVADILVKGLHAKSILIGYDHRFGRNRKANITDLKNYGIQYNFEVIEISAKEIDAIAVSSTKIRKALKEGDILKTNKFLGHPYELCGTVGVGKKIGREIGFPTANICPDFKQKMIPKKGVYIIQTQWKGSKIFGMLNIGLNPTVNKEIPLENTDTLSKGEEIKNTELLKNVSSLKIEAHLFNFSEDLYNQKIQILFLKRLRAEERFASLDHLKKQLSQDKRNALDYINSL